MAEKKKVPAVRFKGFGEEWEESKLEQLALVERGKFTVRPRNDPRFFGGNIPFVQTGDIVNSPLYLSHFSQTLNDDGLKVSKLFPRNTVLITIAANIGDTTITNFDVACTDSVVAIQPKSDIASSVWIKFLLDTKKEELDSKATQNAQKNINLQVLKPLLFAIPSFTEQTQIGHYFQHLDQLIRLHQAKVNKLVNLKKAMLEKMFPKPGADVPEIRFKGFAGAWEERELGEKANFTKGRGYSKKDLFESGTPIILYGRLYTDYQVVITQIDTFALTKKGSILSNGNEVIVPASGETAEDIARAAAIIKSGVLIGGDLNIIYPNDSINSIFLALTLSNGKPKNELTKRAQGKSVVHLRNADLKEIALNYPTVDEQQKIGTYFQNLDQLITLRQSELTKLNHLKKACLAKMFV